MNSNKKYLIYFCSLILISILFLVGSISFVSAAWQYDTGWLDPNLYASQSQHGLCNNGNGGYCGAHQEGWTRCSDYTQNVFNPFWCLTNDCGSDKYREFMLKLNNIPSNFNDCKVSILA